MPSAETNSKSLRYLLRARMICLILMMFLWYVAEDNKAAAAVTEGLGIIIFAIFLTLVFVVLGRLKRLTGALIPAVILLDALMLGLWVSISGGPVSFYAAFFLLLPISSILLLPPRTAVWVVTLVFSIMMGVFYLDFIWHIPASFDTGEINFISKIVESSTPPIRLSIYWHQALRWTIFYTLIAMLCAILMRQVWEREENLRVKEKNLEQKRHFIQMGELTGRIAHGVNTPLGLISGNLEMLMAETRKDGKVYKQLVQIDQYVQRAIRTVRDTLDFGRLSTSEIKKVSFPRVIQAAVMSVQPKLKTTEGKLILDVDPELPEVMAYTEGVFQVVLNLLENAIDSIQPGGIVTLSAHFQYRPVRLSAQDRRGEIRLVVKDTGRGIPPTELKKIFEPFYSTKGFGKGTGLGLAIVKRIVDEHRGEIKVESRVGEGTSFILLFPTEGVSLEKGDGLGGEGEGTFNYNGTIPLGKDL